VLDELHALVTSKRGDLLSLGLARLWRLAPRDALDRFCRPRWRSRKALARFLVPQRRRAASEAAEIVVGRRRGGANRRDARHARAPAPGPVTPRATRSTKSYDLIKRNTTTLVFVNTRSQAEMLFQDLWRNERRRSCDRVCITARSTSRSAARWKMRWRREKLRGVVCTSSLDSRRRLGATSISSSISARRKALQG